MNAQYLLYVTTYYCSVSTYMVLYGSYWNKGDWQRQDFSKAAREVRASKSNGATPTSSPKLSPKLQPAQHEPDADMADADDNIFGEDGASEKKTVLEASSEKKSVLETAAPQAPLAPGAVAPGVGAAGLFVPPLLEGAGAPSPLSPSKQREKSNSRSPRRDDSSPPLTLGPKQEGRTPSNDKKEKRASISPSHSPPPKNPKGEEGDDVHVARGRSVSQKSGASSASQSAEHYQGLLEEVSDEMAKAKAKAKVWTPTLAKP